jgi:hypothetical protein
MCAALVADKQDAGGAAGTAEEAGAEKPVRLMLIRASLHHDISKRDNSVTQSTQTGADWVLQAPEGPTLYQ